MSVFHRAIRTVGTVALAAAPVALPVASPAVAAALAFDGAEAGSGSSADFARVMADERKAWGEVVRSAGTKLD
jgi:hypothetical protein